MKPVSLHAAEAPLRTKPSNYPEPFASRMAGRQKRPLGDLFGLSHFGVNFTTLPPRSVVALTRPQARQAAVTTAPGTRRAPCLPFPYSINCWA